MSNKLTNAQTLFLKKIERSRSEAWFRKNIDNGKEECFLGKQKINRQTFFFFYEIGYLQLAYKDETRLYEKYYMQVVSYKLNEYLNEQNNKL